MEIHHKILVKTENRFTIHYMCMKTEENAKLFIVSPLWLQWLHWSDIEIRCCYFVTDLKGKH